MRRGYSRPIDSRQTNTGQSPRSRIGRRGRTQANLWIFDSPKNEKRLTISGDLNFMLCVLLEGDSSVVGYKNEPGPYSIVLDGQPTNIVPDLEVQYQRGNVEWWEIRRSPTQHQKRDPPATQLARAAAAAGMGYSQRTEKDIAGKAVVFDNWLLLCAAITRARHFSAHREASLLRRTLEHSPTSVRELLNDPTVDPALMIATIARFLQTGRASAELETQFFCEDTILKAQSS